MKSTTSVLQLTCFTFLMGIVFLMNAESLAQTNSEQTVETKRMTPELLWEMGRLGSSALSTDGSKMAYAVRRYELSEDKGTSKLHIVDLATGKDSQVTETWGSLGALQWRMVGDGPDEKLFFEGAQLPENDDADKPSTQAWSLDSGATEAVQITDIKDGISNLKVSDNGSKLAFTLDVKMDQKPNEIYEDLPKADARIIDGLMYRHWNAWHDYSYTHLHVATIGSDGKTGEPTDLMKDIKADCPVPPFGGSEHFNWSPDGTEIAFTMKNVENWAESTDSDVFVIDVDGKSPARNMSPDNKGYDNNPVYSPDGKYLAYNSMERPGFESDRNRIMVVDRTKKSIRELTEGLDQNASHAVWMPDSTGLIFTSETRGTNQLFKIELKNNSLAQITNGRFNWDTVALAPDGNRLIATQTSMLRPAELVQLTIADGTSKTLTKINDDIYEGLAMPIIEERFVDATDGKKIHCWVIHPPEFDANANKKYPMLTYCQGGPQGQIGQWFSYRWNFHLMASQGYVVLAPNRRGLPGFGRKWNDDISGDWGGQAMKDILSATDDMSAEPYVDKDHIAAVGASFGGYTVYWMMGNHRDRFCSMIAHCGVFNLESMYGSTEELFFVNWDLGGPYWKSEDNQKAYDKFSPNRFIGKWETPLLVIHGQKDFRVPVTQGMEAFTAAQVQGVPSRFLYFPEEGHWVQKPQNSVLWHRVFFEWLDRYCKTK